VQWEYFAGRAQIQIYQPKGVKGNERVSGSARCSGNTSRGVREVPGFRSCSRCNRSSTRSQDIELARDATNPNSEKGEIEMKELKESLIVLGAVATLAYLLVQAIWTALQPLVVALSGQLH
jgi:hypothetical protein